MRKFVDRVTNKDECSEIAMTMMLYSVPRIDCDAIVVMPGLGETWRITDAIRSWEKNKTARFLLIAGYNRKEKTWVHLSLDTLKEQPFNLRRCQGVHIGVHAEHTRKQAEWIVRKVQNLEITSLALFVSPYHLLRAYCTVLKAMGSQRIPIIPVPVTIPPDTIIPAVGVDGWEMVPGEVSRLTTYQDKGDVATFDELRAYLSWLWTGSFFKEKN